jgi:hypothetical protein
MRKKFWICVLRFSGYGNFGLTLSPLQSKKKYQLLILASFYLDIEKRQTNCFFFNQKKVFFPRFCFVSSCDAKRFLGEEKL